MLNDLAECNLYGGSIIHGAGNGVFAEHGTFNMYGGEITGGSGKAVVVGYRFIMDGGRIANSQVEVRKNSLFSLSGGEIEGGGVVSVGNVELAGGTIANVKSGAAVNTKGTLYMYDGVITGSKYGVYVDGASSNGNAAFRMTGGEITNNDCAVYVDSVSDTSYAGLTMTGGDIHDNGSEGGAAVVLTPYSELDMRDGSIRNNSGTAGVSAQGRVLMKGGEISGNNGSMAGGVYLSGSNALLNMTGGRIADNHSRRDGGGVYASQSIRGVEIYAGEITGNTAEGRGGGLYAEDGTRGKLDGGSIANNTANGDGGGAYIGTDAPITINGIEFTGNHALGNGGGLYTRSGFFPEGTRITDNRANGNGGGLFLHESAKKSRVEGISLTGNSADKGGGLYNDGCNVLLSNASFTGNRATHGGGVHYGAGQIILDNKVTIQDNEGGNLYFANSCVAYFAEDSFSRDTRIGVSTQKSPTSRTPISFAMTQKDEDYSSCFFVDGDDPGLYIQATADGGTWLQLMREKGSTPPLGPVEPGSWKELQKMINDAGDNGKIKLSKDYIAEDTDTCLIVDEKSVQLDLNGYTIDRNLTNAEPQEDGEVILLESGRLYIEDSSREKTGRITGGNKLGNGGGINAQGGELVLDGVTISGNKATAYGGGVSLGPDAPDTCFQNNVVIERNQAGNGGGLYLGSQKTIQLKGVTLTGNMAGNGGGIYAEEQSTMNLYEATIKNNAATSGSGGGIYVMDKGTINHQGNLILSGNSAKENGGGIFMGRNTQFLRPDHVQANLRVNENTRDGKPSNLFLSDEVRPDVSYLGYKSIIGFSVENLPQPSGAPVSITNGMSQYRWMDHEWYFSDDEDYIVRPGKSELEIAYINHGMVTFDANGGSGTMEPMRWDELTDFILPECDFTPPEGLVFDCWEYDGARWAPGEETQIRSDRTFKAIWRTTNHELAFDLDGGEWPEGTALKTRYDDDERIDWQQYAPTREHYDFLGWDPQPAAMPYYDLTVKAQWALHEYKITLMTAPDELFRVERGTYGMELTKPDDIPKRDGLEFVEWRRYNDDGSLGDIWADGTAITFDGDAAYIARWKEPKPEPPRPSAVSPTAVEILNPSEDLRYSANNGATWRAPVDGKLTLDGLPFGATVAVVAQKIASNIYMEPSSPSDPASVTLPVEVAVRLDLGAYDAEAARVPDAKGLYWDADWPDYEQEPTAVMDVSQPRSFIVAEGEKLDMSLMNAARHSDAVFELDGWYTPDGQAWNADSAVTRTVCDSETIYELNGGQYLVMTLKARWFVRDAQIEYDAGEGRWKGEAPITRAIYMEESALTDNVPTMEGKRLTGWADRQGRVYTDTFTFSDASAISVFGDEADPNALHIIRLTAQYEDKPATEALLTFDTQGGSAVEAMTLRIPAGEEKQSYRLNVDGENSILRNGSGEQEATIQNPTQLGYVFMGWARRPIGTPQLSLSVPAIRGDDDAAAEMTVYAGWRVSQHELKFDLNGGEWPEGAEPKLTYGYGEPIDWEALVPVREHYDFMGWDVETPETMPDNDVAVTAQWTQHLYTVSFLSLPDEVFHEAKAVYGAEVTKPADAPTMEGMTFVEWRQYGDGQLGDAWTDDQPIRVEGDAAYAAQWLETAPEAPTVRAVSPTALEIVDPPEGQSYSVDGGETWRGPVGGSLRFDNLPYGATCEVIARKEASNAFSAPSPASEPTSVTLPVNVAVRLDLGAYDETQDMMSLIARQAKGDYWGSDWPTYDRSPSVNMDDRQQRSFLVTEGEKIDMREMDRALYSDSLYRLDGWYTQHGIKWSPEMEVTREQCDTQEIHELDGVQYLIMTLKARWRIPDARIDLDLGAGHWEGEAPSAATVAFGGTIDLPKPVPAAPASERFVGWKDARGTVYTDTFTFSEPGSITERADQHDPDALHAIRLTAVYEDKPAAQGKLIFDAMDGSAVEPVAVSVAAGEETAEYRVTVGDDGSTSVQAADAETPTTFPNPTREGYAFMGWSMEPVGEASRELEVTATRISDDAAADVTLYAIWKAGRPAFRTHSLLLSGEIGVNFFMELPEMEGVDYADSYMEFTVQSRNGKTTRDDLDPAHRDVNGMGYYGFTVFVSSIQMAAPITAVFHYGDGQTVEHTYSVKQYIQSYERYADRFDATTTALVHAIADYGHYSQPALSATNGWNIGTDYAEMDVFYRDSLDHGAAAAAVEPFALVKDLSQSDIEGIRYDINLLSQTNIRVNFAPKAGYEGSFSAKVDGNAAKATRLSDGRWRVQINDISAHQLGKMYDIQVETASGPASAQVSVLSYVAAVLDSDMDAMYKDSVSTLYYYYQAAMDYRAVHDD